MSRLSWSIADQALSSATNFALAFVVARSLGLAELGSFAIAFSVYALTVELARAVGVEVLAMEVGTMSRESEALGGAVGAAMLAAVAGALPAAIIGLFLRSSTGDALVAMSVFLVAAVVHDSIRNGLIAVGRARTATATDVVWAVVQVATFAAVMTFGSLTAATAIAAWGVAAAAATLTGLKLAAVKLQISSAFGWIRPRVDVIVSLVTEAAGRAGFLQVTTVCIAAILGVAELGRLRSAEMLFGPITALIFVIPQIAVPEAARNATTDGIRKVCVGASVIPAALALAWSAIMAGLPTSAGEMILAENWEPARQLLAPATALVLGSAAVAGAFVGLRGLGRVADTLRLRLTAGVVVLGLGLTGAVVGGIAGAAWAIAAARILTGAAGWHRLTRNWTTGTAPALTELR